MSGIKDVEGSEVVSWTWVDFQPQLQELQSRRLTAASAHAFFRDWSHASALVGDLRIRSLIGTEANTADADARRQYRRYIEEVFPPFEAANQALRQKVIDAGVEVPGFEIPLQRIGTKAALFREANLSLLAEEKTLGAEHSEITSEQTVQWEGTNIPIPKMRPFLESDDRFIREKAWRAIAARRRQDRGRLDDLWTRIFGIRIDIAQNAGLPSYRDYMWRDLMRFDYEPELNLAFHDAVLSVVVPAQRRLSEQRRKRHGLDTIRPWDMVMDAFPGPPLHPFTTAKELENGLSHIFHNVDPSFGTEFESMTDGSLLDLESRENKAPGAVCFSLPVSGMPYVLTNAAGVQDDVVACLHECGHAFHDFACMHLPYFNRGANMPYEFAEVASISMELLGAPYLAADAGGFYDPRDAARARIQMLEWTLWTWIWVAMVDAFQHWAYENATLAVDPRRCDEKWRELTAIYSPADWEGLGDELSTEWANTFHIMQAPFYAIEYAMATVAAVQIWSQSLVDRSAAVQRYRHALSLGGSVPLPKLYEAAGVPFDFGQDVLASAVALIEHTLLELEDQVQSLT